MPGSKKTGEVEPIQVEILFLEGCGGAHPSKDLVKKAAEDLNLPINVEMVLVADDDQARDLQFPGSPTVRINGIDIEPTAPGADPFGLV